MSIEITLYPKRASKSNLIKFLKENGFYKTPHVLDNSGIHDMYHFAWYGYEDYESIDGVEANVVKADRDDILKFKCSEWILHTRTRSSASYNDKKKQNEIIRLARKSYGGSFYNDWYGTNIYTKLNDYIQYTPLEKGLSYIVNNANEKLEQIYTCVEGHSHWLSETIAKQPEELKGVFLTKDPSTILYNSLMPFLVSVLEYFFSQSFVHFLKYDNSLKELMLKEKFKFGVLEVTNIVDNKSSLEQLIADQYNFQNLESINRAYKNYLNIDVYSLLSTKKKVNGKVIRILNTVQEIIESRHNFVHELRINYFLTKSDYLRYISTIISIIVLTTESFEEKGLKIDTFIYR